MSEATAFMPTCIQLVKSQILSIFITPSNVLREQKADVNVRGVRVWLLWSFIISKTNSKMLY